jgi:aryl-alcohol dehydrogenase-like predicted oxidoreductase
MRISLPVRLGRSVSAIGLGCWQLGADWGDVDDDVAQAILNAAADAGTTFFDTADVYGDGRSEKAVGRFLASRADAERLVVATKMGRRADPHVAEAYTLDNFRAWTDRSCENLGVDHLDLVQLHCPPSSVLADPRTYENLAMLVAEGRVENVGVSVETVQEALVAIGEPGVTSVQIIVNVFRRKPLERVLGAAHAAGIMVIARVPLASGLLSGRYDEHTTFPENDHRNYNRTGAAFDVGETFSGVPYEVGVKAAREVSALTPPGWTTAQMALRWILDQKVDVVIPGARTVEQAVTNAAVGDLPSLSDETHAALAEIYNRDIREHVHGRW